MLLFAKKVGDPASPSVGGCLPSYTLPSCSSCQGSAERAWRFLQRSAGVGRMSLASLVASFIHRFSFALIMVFSSSYGSHRPMTDQIFGNARAMHHSPCKLQRANGEESMARTQHKCRPPRCSPFALWISSVRLLLSFQRLSSLVPYLWVPDFRLIGPKRRWS
jgi:hypothetical protein